MAKRRVVEKLFRLKNKDEVEKFLKSQGFEVRVEKEEEELEEGRINVVGVFECLEAFKWCDGYMIEVNYETCPSEEGGCEEVCTVSAQRGSYTLVSRGAIPSPQGLSEAIAEVSKEAEAKVRKWLEGVSAFRRCIEEMGLRPSISIEDRVEASVDIREGGRYHGYIRMLADHNGVAIHVQLWELSPARGLEVAKKVVEALKDASLELAQLQP
jgi:hypothetical protein